MPTIELLVHKSKFPNNLCRVTLVCDDTTLKFNFENCDFWLLTIIGIEVYYSEPLKTTKNNLIAP